MEVNDQQDIENIEFDVIDFKVFQHHQQIHLHHLKYSVQDVVGHMVKLIYQNMFANQNNMYCNLYISMFECNDFK